MTLQEGKIVFPRLFLIFRQGTWLEIAEYVVLAERWAPSSALIFPIDVPFCFCALCLCVNTELSLNIPKEGWLGDSTVR